MGKRDRHLGKRIREAETEELELLESWIESQKPDSGSNPLAAAPLPKNGPIGRISGDGDDAVYSCYAGATKFDQLPLSEKTKRGLKDAKFVKMTDIQRASLPHSLCGRDILGAAKTGSGKTLAFVIPVLEKLHRERWGPENGVGSIIISPTRELAGQLFDVLKAVGKHHNFSAGLLIGGRKDVDMEKVHVNGLNILVCTPGRLLQHMDETPNFDCSELQVLVLDEADRILDVGFKQNLNAIISQLPRHRQTFLFSATQTKSVQDLARLSLNSPEYVSVHEESVTATPGSLQQTAIVVPLDQKLDVLWSFIKAHLNSKILVFLSSCKQVRFVFEAFKKLRPGISLKCLHGRMKQERRMGVYSQFCEERSVLFATDVASRGLDFNKAVDWVVQLDCPDDVAAYIHRVGRTARFRSKGRSVLFLMPSEIKMLEKLQAAKIPLRITKPNNKRLQSVSGLLSALLVKYPDLQALAQRSFITYLRSIYLQKDKEVFDVMNLPIDQFSASLGLPMTPKIRFLNNKIKGKQAAESQPVESVKIPAKVSAIPKENLFMDDFDEEDNADKDIFLPKDTQAEEGATLETGDITIPSTRILKKKKLKINIHRPVGTRVVFDEEGNSLAPLARIGDAKNTDVVLDQDKRDEYYKKLREELKQADKEDKIVERQRLREKRMKEKLKRKKGNLDSEDGESEEDDHSGSEDDRKHKKSKIYFNSDNENDDDDNGIKTDSVSLAEQEELALKLLTSMH